jgi:excisionase family DNA binding protein
MEKNLTHDTLPQGVTTLLKELREFKNLFIQEQKDTPNEHPEKPLNVQEAAQFLNLTVATIYSKVSKGELPVMKRSKRLYFSSAELLAYIKDGRKKSNAEIEQESEAYLTKLKRNRNV